ncbi:MAG: hypothetical protein DBX59_06320 [Bacillota bacterium]|nr:MAG: hypothetical protein DBX59_06320 [Bacillota bacterium]
MENMEEVVAQTPLFENKSLIGKAENADFQKYAVKRQFGKMQYIGAAAFALLGALFLVIEDYVIGGVMLALAVVYLFLPFIVSKIALNKKNVPDLVERGMEETYLVYEDRIDAFTASGGLPMGSNVLYYRQIREARANGNYIYLYISKVQAHIMLASGFTAGSAAAFLSFLESKNVKVYYK